MHVAIFVVFVPLFAIFVPIFVTFVFLVPIFVTFVFLLDDGARSEYQNIRLSDYQKKFNPYKLLQLTHIKWYNKIQNWSKSELTSDEKMNKEKKLIHLTHLSPGKSGIVVEIHGGHGAARRLEALGLRVGARITKISAQPMHGPITVKVGQTSLAIGYGLAHKVMVEVEE